jgi:preprotein translocase subunit SecA
MKLIDKFSKYTLSSFGFIPRKSQIKAAKLLANKHSLVHMDTGEGKTVVAALAALIALEDRRRIYIVTVNDYLAKRDMDMFFRFFSKAGYVPALNTFFGDKQSIHSSDLIYTSVQNLLFDFVSNEFNPDGIKFTLDMAILDEIDYTLLDSANTRYSVSMGDGCIKQDSMLLDAVWCFTDTLQQCDFTAEVPKKRLMLEDSSYEKIEIAFSVMPDNPHYKDVMFLCHTALLARYCYISGVDYLVERDGVLSIINLYNGRACRNSFFEYELDYFLRKKECIRFAGMAGGLHNTMSAPILFRKFKTVVGMSGTTKHAREELGMLLGTGTKTIPSARRKKRIDRQIRFKTRQEKYSFIKDFISEHRKKYAYLVITEHEREACELYEMLKFSYSVNLLINQCSDDEQIFIDNAGNAGQILVSTNLIGRGTDIITDAEQGLCVFITHKGTDARVVIQARGRAGRNGNVGLTFTLHSDEDERSYYGADFEAQRSISLCEDIIFENAKLSLVEWADKHNITDYAPFWLDFRNSLRGRIFVCCPDSINSMIEGACNKVREEMKVLVEDITHSFIQIGCE